MYAYHFHWTDQNKQTQTTIIQAIGLDAAWDAFDLQVPFGKIDFLERHELDRTNDDVIGR